MKKPRLYLDVDGVLNLRGIWTDKIWHDVRRSKCLGFPIDWSLTMGDRLKALPVDIYWLTTWGAHDNANKWIAPLFGWDALPVVGAERQESADGLMIVQYGRGSVGRWWKFAALEEQLAAEEDHPPFIWIDDQLAGEMTNDDDIRAWLETLPVKTMVVSPHSGLLPSHIDAIEHWLEEINGNHEGALEEAVGAESFLDLST